jgi:endonuclease/exonuclease/phosphatase family metal-dependent hydrolase
MLLWHLSSVTTTFSWSLIIFLAIYALTGCEKASPQGSTSPAASGEGIRATSPERSGKKKSPSKSSLDSMPETAIVKAPHRTELKIASYNINCGNPHLTAIVETIQKADCDLVCLQETTGESEAYLLKMLAKNYPYIRFQGHKGRYGAERFGFLSKLPVIDYQFIPPEHGLFGFCIADVQFNDQFIQVFTVHLQPILFPNDAGIRDMLSAIGSAEKIHSAEIEAVLKYVKKELPAIIAGDFNSVASFEGPRTLLANGFLDSFAEVNDNPESLPTWHWLTKNGELALRIDYIFHSKHFLAVEANVIKSEASDHYLVFIRLKIANK